MSLLKFQSALEFDSRVNPHSAVPEYLWEFGPLRMPVIHSHLYSQLHLLHISRHMPELCFIAQSMSYNMHEQVQRIHPQYEPMSMMSSKRGYVLIYILDTMQKRTGNVKPPLSTYTQKNRKHRSRVNLRGVNHDGCTWEAIGSILYVAAASSLPFSLI